VKYEIHKKVMAQKWYHLEHVKIADGSLLWSHNDNWNSVSFQMGVLS
jgi:hypothetical protein